MDLLDPGAGITRDSLTYYRDHRHEFADFVRITVRFPGFGDPYDPYLMVLTDGRGDRMLLSGCTTGYVGEGPNGSLEILVGEGVDIETALAVTDAARLSLTRIPEGWCVEFYEPAHRADTGDEVVRSLVGPARVDDYGRSR